MREVAFIKQNKEKWVKIEKMFIDKDVHPDILSQYYLEVVNDLSYAQTFYPNSNTVQYLNQIASRAHLRIYKTKRIEKNKIKNFFLTDVPLIAYAYRRYILYAFIIFFIFTLIGAMSTAQDESFVRIILGDSYVNMTKENIKNGQPIAVYGQENELWTFLMIAFNNVKVAMTCYLLGLFGGIGTGYALMQNGIMLGSFQYMFYNEGVLAESMRGIWIHGAMEIFSIIITGSCGLILGASWLFPQSYSRFASLKKGFSTSFKLFVSTLPFILFAAVLEGFVTRHSQNMPHVISIMIIFTTLAIIFYYYIIFPRIIFNKKKNATL